MNGVTAAVLLLQRQRDILKNNLELFERRMDEANHWHMQNYKEKENALAQLGQVENALRALAHRQQSDNSGQQPISDQLNTDS